ncbi:hypothetical protein [Streptomyces sp. NPDC059564]|uniref:hypothetical protein n=1 Tax=Streptomyces sp. NPDC059564 TaxID=3346865 RepID=UPI0036CACACC
MRAAAVALALLAAGAGGCGQTTAGSGPSSADTGPKAPFVPARLVQAWKAPTESGDVLLTKLMATWHTKTALYIGRGTGVAILDPATGKQLGTVAPPEPDMHLCGMTEGLTASGLGAIAWVKGDPLDPNASCDRVSLVDTRKGSTIVWTTQVAGVPVGGKALTDDTTRLAFVSGDVLAVMTSNTVVGLRPDKSEAWTWRNPGATANSYMLNWDMTAHGDRIMIMLGVEGGGPEMWQYSVAILDAKGRQVSAAPVAMPVPPRGRVKLVGGSAMTAVGGTCSGAATA